MYKDVYENARRKYPLTDNAVNCRGGPMAYPTSNKFQARNLEDAISAANCRACHASVAAQNIAALAKEMGSYVDLVPQSEDAMRVLLQVVTYATAKDITERRW